MKIIMGTHKIDTQVLLLGIIMALTVIVPVVTLIVAGREGLPPEVFQEYPNPTPSPLPSPSTVPSGCMNIKVFFEGLSSDRQDLSATLVAVGTSWQNTNQLNADGTSACLDLAGLDGTKTYDFILYAHPYLTIKKTVNLQSLPALVDFGIARTGDLNGDDQINSLDWSWMRKNFGQNGDE